MRRFGHLGIVSAVLAAAGLFCISANGGIIAYQVPAGTVGNQNYGGSLGMDFVVNQPIAVSQFGVFDDGSNGLSLPITAYIYDRSTQQSLEKIVFPGGIPGTLVGGSRILALPTPLILPAGFQGTIVADGYGAGELNGNSGAPVWTTNDGGGMISFVGTSRFGTAGVFPATPDGGPFNRYAAGTFEYDATSVGKIGIGTPIAVPNPSFELPGRSDGGYGNDTTGWTPDGGTNAGDYNPPTTPAKFSESIPSGGHVAFVNGGSLVSDPLGETLQPDTLYVLEVDWGHRLDSANPQHSMNLRAGGVALGWVNNVDIFNGPTPASGEFETARGYFTANHNASVGAPLDILFSKGGAGQAVFDNVRLSKITDAAIPVTNFSFEADDVPSNNGFQFGATGWTQGGSGGGVFEGASQIVPADASQSAFILGGGSLTQTLSGVPLAPGYRYVLLADVADRDSTAFVGYQLELLAGGQTVAIDNDSLGVVTFSGSPGQFYTTAVVDVLVSGDNPLVGQDLGIRLTALGSGGNQTYFDNVRLFAFAAPEPSSCLLLVLGGLLALLVRVRRSRR